MIKWQSPSTEMVGGFFLCVYIILGLQIVNLFCILVMWKNVTIYNYSNEYDFMGLLSVNRFCIFKVQTIREVTLTKT